MPYINVNDAYILDNTGKQVDDAVDYALANSNRNLLDNPFFTVRQMGTGGVTGIGYAVDRWKNTGGANLTQTPRSPYGITFASSSGYQVDQALWDYPAEYLDGERLTISVMTSGGNIAQATGVFTATSSTAAKVAVTSADGNFTVGLYYIPSARAVPFVRITTPSGKFPVNAPILAAKLELGSYSTLANDVPPDYGEELRKCQRYFWRLGNATYLTACTALAESATQAFGDVVLPVPMRAQPSVQTNGTFLCYTGAQSITITSLTGNASSYPTVNPNRVALRATVASGLTIGTFYNIQSRNNAAAYIDFSADL